MAPLAMGEGIATVVVQRFALGYFGSRGAPGTARGRLQFALGCDHLLHPGRCTTCSSAVLRGREWSLDECSPCYLGVGSGAFLPGLQARGFLPRFLCEDPSFS